MIGTRRQYGRYVGAGYHGGAFGALAKKSYGFVQRVAGGLNTKRPLESFQTGVLLMSGRPVFGHGTALLIRRGSFALGVF
jgi:hypothetical protein